MTDPTLEALREACAKVCDGIQKERGASASNQWEAGYEAAERCLSANIRALDLSSFQNAGEQIAQEVEKELGKALEDAQRLFYERDAALRELAAEREKAWPDEPTDEMHKMAFAAVAYKHNFLGTWHNWTSLTGGIYKAMRAAALSEKGKPE